MFEETFIVGIYTHTQTGRRYAGIHLIPNATKYERTKLVGVHVKYYQLEQGQFPAGTEWTREYGDFSSQFERDQSQDLNWFKSVVQYDEIGLTLKDDPTGLKNISGALVASGYPPFK